MRTFLGTNKVVVNYRLTKKGKEHINFFRLMFPYERDAGFLYFRKETGHYVLSKTFVTEDVLKLNRIKNGQYYLNIKKYFGTEQLYYNIYKEDGEYLFFPTTASEALGHRFSRPRKEVKSGRFNGQNLTLTKEDADRLYGGKPYLHIYINQSDRPRIELEACDDFSEEDRLSAKYGGYNKVFEQEELDYKLKANPEKARGFYVIKSFAQKTHMRKNDALNCYFEGSKLIIEAKPAICDICHKPIRQFVEGGRTICRCSSCTEALDRFYNIGRLSREDLVSRLTVYNRQLDEMLDNLKSMEVLA